MKKFVLKSLIFSFLILLLLAIVVYRADEIGNSSYSRFTTPKHKNLILGTSRAAQGLQPSKFKEILSVDIGNFAFTVADSPFGKVYFESVKRKHSKEKGGVFIVTVDPWSISSWCSDPNKINDFRENNRTLNKVKEVDLNPNMSFIYENFNSMFQGLIYPSKNTLLHEDGWLEVKAIPMDSTSLMNRISRKANTYRNYHLPKTKYSKVRFEYLIKTMNYLNQFGDVYLVRLPVHDKILEIEEGYMPDFDSKIKQAIDISKGYLDLNLNNDQFIYTDGNHLYKTSGEIVSTIVAKWIKNQ